jgi:DNA-binding TFAR19-related protein (PDSD5 family)
MDFLNGEIKRKEYKLLIDYISSFLSLDFKPYDFKMILEYSGSTLVRLQKDIEFSSVDIEISKFNNTNNSLTINISIMLDDSVFKDIQSDKERAYKYSYKIKNHLEKQIKNSKNLKHYHIHSVLQHLETQGCLDFVVKLNTKEQFVDFEESFFKLMFINKINSKIDEETLEVFYKEISPFYYKNKNAFLKTPFDNFIEDQKFKIEDFKEYFELNYKN